MNEVCERDTGLQAENLNTVTVVSPISSLSTDVLLEIFKVNANMDKDGPLEERYPITHNKDRAINATRLSSQWRGEVILRTQNSPLYVKGNISFKTYNIYRPSWWLDFFNLSWPRIRKFDLDVLFDRDTSVYSHLVKALSFLSRPASALQSFRMNMENRCEPWETGSLLFDNHAPQLRFFQIRNIQFSDKYAWLSQIHNLHIYRRDGNILTSVDLLYEALSRMHNLESFYFEDTISSPYIAPHRVPIHLPRLKYVQFRNEIFREQPTKSPIWTLLNYIIPKFGCSIRLVLDLPVSDDIDSNMLSNLAKNYFQINQPTFLDLATHTNYFTFSDTKDLGYQLRDELIPETPFFNLVLDFFVGNALPLTDRRIYQLFKELLFLSFPEVVELHLTVYTAHATFFADHQFGRLLSSFTALRKVVTVPETLYRLCTSPVVTISTIFPLLGVFEIIVEAPLQGEVASHIHLPQTLVSFLRLRKEGGVPISTFTYRCASQSGLSDQEPLVDDLTSLDTFTGLKVVWDLKNIGTGQYICGTGTPEELDFVEEYRKARRLRELYDT